MYGYFLLRFASRLALHLPILIRGQARYCFLQLLRLLLLGCFSLKVCFIRLFL